MTKLIIKNGFIAGGTTKASAHLGHLLNYIAKREGVEVLTEVVASKPVTQPQLELIAQLLRDVPDSQNSHEYQDYLNTPTCGTASAYITVAMEQAVSSGWDKKLYLDYIANRPRVEKVTNHGLFTGGDDAVELQQVINTLQTHQGNVWVPILSLRREDAQRLGFDSASVWRDFLAGQAPAIADSLKIRPENFRWYAAFHDEGGHPHVHMVCYSIDPQEGFLTKVGIEKMKSALVNELFRPDLIPIYNEKTIRRDALKETSRNTLEQLLQGIGDSENPKLHPLMAQLSDRLQYTTGKKQYGYLHPKLKEIVNAIVDELGKEETVAKAYAYWWESKQQVDYFYSDQPLPPPPLSQCPDFKPLKNMVIQEAMGILTQIQEQTQAQSQGQSQTQSQGQSQTQSQSQPMEAPLASIEPVVLSSEQGDDFSSYATADTPPPTTPVSVPTVSPLVAQAIFRLLYQVGTLLRDTSKPPEPSKLRLTGKQRQKLREKKAAMGQKEDDFVHEYHY